jgi:hypothetical protein
LRKFIFPKSCFRFVFEKVCPQTQKKNASVIWLFFE